MKKQFFKTAIKLGILSAALMFGFVACDDDDDPKVDVLVEDGFYVKGAGTALTDYDSKGMMATAKNEVLQEDRASLKELYVAVKAGSEGFNIYHVSGKNIKTWGPGADFALVAEADKDAEEPKLDFWRGSLAETQTAFTVPEDGLYHVVIDTDLGKVVIARVKWGAIGGATPGGWGAYTEMPSTGFNLNKMVFEVPEITLTVDTWKFRYADNWKIILDSDLDLGSGKKGVKVNTNFGGAIDALEAGGGNISNATYGVYKITMTWELGVGHSATIVWVKEGEPLPEYPEALYLVGDATAYGWDAPGGKADAVMHKIAGGGDNEGVYWKILHFEGGKGFKISAANWGSPNLGFGDVSEYDANGVTVSENGGNMSVAENNMYIVVIDLRNNMKKVSVKAAEVFGIGGAFGAGNWTEDDATTKFTIDLANKALVSPALTADAAVRIYANHAWIPSWWNAEFNVFSGVIEYRNNGGDQNAVNGTTGQVVTLMFDNNTGKIE